MADKIMITDEQYLLELGHNLAQLRKKKGYTQLLLSIDSGVAKSYIAELERGKRNPTLTTLRKLLKPLGGQIRSILPK